MAEERVYEVIDRTIFKKRVLFTGNFTECRKFCKDSDYTLAYEIKLKE